MIRRLYALAQALYYPGPVHKVNPCDLGTHRSLRAWGRGFRRIGGECPCCAGARVVAAATLAALAPPALALALIGVVVLAAVLAEWLSPTAELNEGYEAYEAAEKEQHADQ